MTALRTLSVFLFVFGTLLLRLISSPFLAQVLVFYQYSPLPPTPDPGTLTCLGGSPPAMLMTFTGISGSVLWALLQTLNPGAPWSF